MPRRRQCRGDCRWRRVQFAATIAALWPRPSIAPSIPRYHRNRRCSGRRRRSQRPYFGPHHVALQGADHAQRCGTQLDRQACPRLALLVHAPRLSRNSSDLVRMLFAYASRLRDTRLAMFDFAILCPDHRRRAASFSRSDGQLRVAAAGESGYVRIRSADPRDAPAINPNYLATQKDRETIVAGVAAMRRIFQAPAMARYIAEEIEPGHQCDSDDDLLDFIRRRC